MHVKCLLRLRGPRCCSSPRRPAKTCLQSSVTAVSRPHMAHSRVTRSPRRIDIHAPGIPGGQPLDAASVPPEYWRAFSIVAFAMNRFVVDHIIRSARLFDNDTEALVLFGMLAHLKVVHLMPPPVRRRPPRWRGPGESRTSSPSFAPYGCATLPTSPAGPARRFAGSSSRCALRAEYFGCGTAGSMTSLQSMQPCRR